MQPWVAHILEICLGICISCPMYADGVDLNDPSVTADPKASTIKKCAKSSLIQCA